VLLDEGVHALFGLRTIAHATDLLRSRLMTSRHRPNFDPPVFIVFVSVHVAAPFIVPDSKQ
jgi:hypothetical protein